MEKDMAKKEWVRQSCHALDLVYHLKQSVFFAEQLHEYDVVRSLKPLLELAEIIQINTKKVFPTNENQ